MTPSFSFELSWNPVRQGFGEPGRIDLYRMCTWVLPMIGASSASCSGPNSSCAANDMEANVLLQMSEVNEIGTDALSDDVIPPREEA